MAPLFLALLVVACAASDIRLNQIQIKGSRNSYHLAPYPYTLPQWGFTHSPINVQINHGIYALEYDFYYDGGRFTAAQHTLYDANTTCADLRQCLVLIKAAHVRMNPKPILWVALGNKESWSESVWDRFDKIILSVWRRSELWTPDDFRGTYRNVSAALKAKGWPKVSEIAGKVVIILDQYDTVEYQINTHARLENRVAFPYFNSNNKTHHNSVILKLNVPDANLKVCVQEGYLVRTRADRSLPQIPGMKMPTTEDGLNAVYFRVIDLNRDQKISKTEMRSFLDLAMDPSDSALWAQQVNLTAGFDTCGVSASNNSQPLLVPGDSFNCWARNFSKGTVFALSDYPSLNASYTRQATSINNGAHFVSSDFPLPGSGPSNYTLSLFAKDIQCNPVTTDANCTNAQLARDYFHYSYRRREDGGKGGEEKKETKGKGKDGKGKDGKGKDGKGKDGKGKDGKGKGKGKWV